MGLGKLSYVTSIVFILHFTTESQVLFYLQTKLCDDHSPVGQLLENEAINSTMQHGITSITTSPRVCNICMLDKKCSEYNEVLYDKKLSKAIGFSPITLALNANLLYTILCLQQILNGNTYVVYANLLETSAIKSGTSLLLG